MGLRIIFRQGARTDSSYHRAERRRPIHLGGVVSFGAAGSWRPIDDRPAHGRHTLVI